MQMELSQISKLQDDEFKTAHFSLDHKFSKIYHHNLHFDIHQRKIVASLCLFLYCHFLIFDNAWPSHPPPHPHTYTFVHISGYNKPRNTE